MEEELNAELLPSANMGLTLNQPAPAATEPVSAPAVGGGASRTLFIVGLALAAAALVGVIAYLALSPSGSSDDPGSVKAGAENREYEDPATPTATATATAKPTVRPKPVYRPPPPPVDDDPYADLDDG